MRTMSFGLPLLCISLSANAQTVSLNPVADAFVTTGPTNNLVNNNYGAAGAVSLAAAALPKGEFRSFLRFDTAAAKSSFDTLFGVGNWIVESAELRLSATSPNNSIFNGSGAGPGGTNVNFAGLFGINWISDDSWVEGTGMPNTPAATGINFANQPSSTGDEILGAHSFPGGTVGLVPYPVAPSAGFVADVAGGSLLSMRLLAGDSGVAYTLSSRTGAVSPVLAITAAPIPEPISGVWIGVALAILGGRRRLR